MDFKAYNKDHDIDTDKVFSCHDMEQLRDWKILMEHEIMTVKNRISKMKGKHRDGLNVSNKSFEDAKIYRRVQAGLLNQIVLRIREVKEIEKKQKETFRIANLGGQLKFWKNKVKEIAPEKFFIFCKELNEQRK